MSSNDEVTEKTMGTTASKRQTSVGQKEWVHATHAIGNHDDGPLLTVWAGTILVRSQVGGRSRYGVGRQVGMYWEEMEDHLRYSRMVLTRLVVITSKSTYERLISQVSWGWNIK